MDPVLYPPCSPLRQVGRYLVPDVKEASFCAVFCPFSVKALVDVQGAVLDQPGGVPGTPLLSLLFRQLLAPTEVLALEPQLEQGKLEVHLALSDRPFEGADAAMYPQRFEVEQLGLRAVVTFERGPVDLLAVTDAQLRPAMLPADIGTDSLLLELPISWLGLNDDDLRVATADPIHGPVFLPLQNHDWVTWFSIFGQVAALDWTPLASRPEADVVKVIAQYTTLDAFQSCVHALHDRFLLLRESANSEGQGFHRVRLHLANRRLAEEEVERARLWQLKREIEDREQDLRLCLAALDNAVRVEVGDTSPPLWLLPVVDFFRGWLQHLVIDASATIRAQGAEAGVEEGLARSVAAWGRVIAASESWCRAQREIAEVDKAAVLKLLDRWCAEGIRICEERLTSEEELLLQWVFKRAAKTLQKDLKEVQNSAEEEARRAEEELLGELEREAEMEEQKNSKNKKKSKKKRDKKDSKKKSDEPENTEAPKDLEANTQVPRIVVAAPTPAGSRTQKGVEAQNKVGSARSRDVKKSSSEPSSDKREAERKASETIEKERLAEVLEAVSKSEQLHHKRGNSDEHVQPESSASVLCQEDLDMHQGSSRTSSISSSQDLPPGVAVKSALSTKGYSHSRTTTEAGSDAPTQLCYDAVTDTTSETPTASDTHSLAPTNEVESSSASGAMGPENDWMDSTAPTQSMPSDSNNCCTLPTMLLLAGAMAQKLPPMPDGARCHTELQSNHNVSSITNWGDLKSERWGDLAEAALPDAMQYNSEVPPNFISGRKAGSIDDDGCTRSNATNDAQPPEVAELASHISSLFPTAKVHFGPPDVHISPEPSENDKSPPDCPSVPEVPLSRDADPPSSPERGEPDLAKQILSMFPGAKVHIGPPAGSPKPLAEERISASRDGNLHRQLPECSMPLALRQHSNVEKARPPLEVLFGSMPQTSSSPPVEWQPNEVTPRVPQGDTVMNESHQKGNYIFPGQWGGPSMDGPQTNEPQKPSEPWKLSQNQSCQNVEPWKLSSREDASQTFDPLRFQTELQRPVEQWQSPQNEQWHHPENEQWRRLHDQVRQAGGNVRWNQNEGAWPAMQMKGSNEQPHGLPASQPEDRVMQWTQSEGHWQASQHDTAWKSTDQSWVNSQQQQYSEKSMESPRMSERREPFQLPSPGTGASLRSQLRQKGERLLSQMDPDRGRNKNRMTEDSQSTPNAMLNGALKKRQPQSKGMTASGPERNLPISSMFASGIQPGMMGPGAQPCFNFVSDSMPTMSVGPFPPVEGQFQGLDASFQAMEEWTVCAPPMGDQMMMVPAFNAPSGFSMPTSSMIQPAPSMPGNLSSNCCGMDNCSTKALEAQLMAAQPTSYED